MRPAKQVPDAEPNDFGERATMRRRDILAGAGSLAAGASFPAPAISQGIRQLKLQRVPIIVVRTPNV